MSSPQIATPKHGMFRGTVFAFALVLGCGAAWILAPEYYRPAQAAFPTNAQAAAATATERGAATRAATLGGIRGDLWADCALTYLELYWGDHRNNANAQESTANKQADEASDRALALAPHDARIWLALAGINSRVDGPNQKAAAAMRMSYYTGANDVELITMRLPLAVRSQSIGDTDFQQLVSHDIQLIVTRRPDMKPVIVAAYRGALPIGQQFLEKTLEDIDPGLLATLRSKG